VLAIMSIKPEILVAKDEILVALAIVLVAISALYEHKYVNVYLQPKTKCI